MLCVSKPARELFTTSLSLRNKLSPEVFTWVYWNAYGRGFAVSGPSTQHQAVGFFFTTMYQFTGQLLYKNFWPETNVRAPSSALLHRFILLWLFSFPQNEDTFERAPVWRCSRHPSSCDIEYSGHTTRRPAEELPVFARSCHSQYRCRRHVLWIKYR